MCQSAQQSGGKARPEHFGIVEKQERMEYEKLIADSPINQLR